MDGTSVKGEESAESNMPANLAPGVSDEKFLLTPVSTLAGPGLGASLVDSRDGTRMHWHYEEMQRSEEELSRLEAQCDQLCQRCQDVAQLIAWSRASQDRPREQRQETVPEGKRRKALDHHETILALKESAERGCHLCCLFSLVHAQPTPYQPNHYILDICKSSIVLKPESGKKLILGLGYAERHRSLQWSVPAWRTQDPTTIALARTWLDACMASHHRCSDVTSYKSGPLAASGSIRMAFTPSRLIGIESSGGIVDSIRLVLRDEIDPHRRYTALSHCWGGADILKLTKMHLEEFQSKIPLHLLPKTFMDAVQVTVAMGLQYLWIDSLCIIQDSENDWLRESQQMGDVYQNSDLTLAALNAQNSHEGLFIKRPPERYVTPCWIHNGENYSKPTYVLPPYPQKPPLYERGWVIQERCLSRRILVFGSDQLRWECIEGEVSERHPEFRAHIPDFRSLNNLVHSMLTGPSPPLSTKIMSVPIMDIIRRNSNHWIHQWWSIVAEYSTCLLTFVKDRYPAIRGLVNIVAGAKGASITYGLWRPFLLTELLWFTSDPAEERIPISAPSWSWLSVGSGIAHHYCDIYQRNVPLPLSIMRHDLAEIYLGADQQDDSAASTERIGVNAQILPMTRSSSLREQMDLYGHSRVVYPFRLYDGRKLGITAEAEMWDGVWHPDTTQHLDTINELWAIQIIQDIRRDSNRTFNCSSGLVIAAVDEPEGIFERVGFYHINWNENGGIYHTYKHDEPFPVSQHWAMKDGKRWFGERRTIQLV